MRTVLIQFILGVLTVKRGQGTPSTCGCKSMRQCYVNMLEELTSDGEVQCVEESVIGSCTIEVYLQALTTYCGDFINIIETEKKYSLQKRTLYEVRISAPSDPSENSVHENNPVSVIKVPKPEQVVDDQDATVRMNNRWFWRTDVPVILIDAGQRAGASSVGFALYIIQQLLACEENQYMLDKVNWVILPSVNPDGMEYEGVIFDTWTKNVAQHGDELFGSSGIDISRNFDSHWSTCESVLANSGTYPGTKANSEPETQFVTEIIEKYANQAEAYISLRRNGHSLLYPFGYKKGQWSQEFINASISLMKKINLRAGGLTVFTNTSIYEMSGEPVCGSSVDLAYEKKIPLTFEMRIFPEDDVNFISLLQPMPKGYNDTLRSGYMAGIKELHQLVLNSAQTKNGKIR